MQKSICNQMAAIKSVCLVYFVLLSYGFCYGGRILNEEVKKGSDNPGTGTMNGDGNGDGGSNNDRNPDSGDASTDGFRFRGIIGGWDGIPTIEVPDFDIPVIGGIPTIEVPGFDIPVIGIPSFSIGGGIDIDFGGSDDPELGKNGGPDTKPGDGGARDDPKVVPVNPIDGDDSSTRGRKNAYKADNHEPWENKNKMQEMMGNAMAPKESD